jgi:hypothetical protein
MNSYQFPRQNVLCDEKLFSHELLNSLLEKVYSSSPPFTGYLKIAGERSFLHFLFFFNGAPYSAGKYVDGKPISYSIRDFGEHLAASSEKEITVTLCETDPVLLKNMLLFLQKEPDVKAPTTLIDFEGIVRQISQVGSDAMIALCKGSSFNFFFFKDGKGAISHFSDLSFARPEKMMVVEEMLKYAFYGDNVQAFIYRDMATTMDDDSNSLDKASLLKLFSIGSSKNRRKEDAETLQLPPGVTKNRRKSGVEKSQLPEGAHYNRRKGDSGTSGLPPGVQKNRRKSDSDSSKLPPGVNKSRRKDDQEPAKLPPGVIKNRRNSDPNILNLPSGVPKNRRKGSAKEASTPAIDSVEALINIFRPKSNLSSYVIAIESGPLKGERCFVTLPCIIGRSNCDLILNDRLVSRRHAELKIVEENLVIEDLASTNGTKVNGKLVALKRISSKDLISIGPIDLRISPA